MARASDIPIEPPLASGPGIVRAAEDRSYLGYIAAAILSALLGGFAFAVWVPLASTGTIGGADRVPWMIQAHGWVQLQGWAGLFVAGMAIRLIPRFAGRRPVPRRVTVPLLAVLVVPVVLRIVLQTWATGSTADAVALAIGVSTAAGTLGVAGVLAVTLARGKKAREPWRYFAWAGTVWWAMWAGMALANVPGNDLVPGLLERRENDAFLWAVMLGPIGNFIWAVQSRSVPIFYGRKTPQLIVAAGPGLLLNAGAAFIVLGAADEESGQLSGGLGFVFAGIALLALPPICGAVYGQAKRLRPRARSAARFVIAANIAAMVAGGLMIWGGVEAMGGDDYAAWSGFDQRDAARHLLGVGTITMLILGMARLVAPFFALERTESGVPMFLERLPFWLLVGALVVRAAVPLLGDQIDRDAEQHALATAGLMAWTAIAVFAFSVARAVRAEPRTKRALDAIAAKARD